MADEVRCNRVMGALMSMLVVSAASIGVYSAHPALPSNPIELPLEKQLPIVNVFPQGWKFFTRDPQLADAVPLRLVGRAWLPDEHQVTQSPSNVFGASRQGRAIGPELQWALASLGDSDWEACTAAPATCLDAAPVKVVRTTLEHPQLCGPIGVVSQRPVPWAWARSARPVTMPSKVIRLEIQC